MPLPVPQLDDRRFQDIVDQAKRLIPTFCPEWTDHNVSDPGVAMIELFAWMTELLLYRVNQVPDKLYVKFLELLGVRLEPPRAARAPITFYLSAPQPAEVVIPSGTEVATVRTETSDAIVFTTEDDMPIRPPNLRGAYTGGAGHGGTIWTAHDLRKLELSSERIAIFPAQPNPGDAFYLALEQDHSQHVLALVVACEVASGAGIDPAQPPLEWQVWQGGPTRWANCELEYDGTGGFNWSGEIVLRLPEMAEGDVQGQRAYWLRCRLTNVQADPSKAYRVSPQIERLRVEARGGTVGARHGTTVQHELLGQSDGTPGQQFTLLRAPLLARDRRRDYLIVEPPSGAPERWDEVPDFADSGPEDRHFTLDSLEGMLTLGPALLQPDGTVYRFGAAPARGAQLRFSRYQYGGGMAGNVPAGTLSVLKTSIPYVARVLNRQPAVGGRDAQSLEDAKLRTPQALRTRTRAVTADDFEHLARQVPGVARVRCLAPGAHPGDPADPKPGQIFLIALPEVDDPLAPLRPEHLILSAEAQAALSAYLQERQLLGAKFDVVPPNITWVAVQATLRLLERSDTALIEEVRRQAEVALYRYLNPYTGGAQGTGWTFGRALHLPELYALLQRIPAVEFVEDIRLFNDEPGSIEAPRQLATPLVLPRHGLVCSGRHRVSIG